MKNANLTYKVLKNNPAILAYSDDGSIVASCIFLSKAGDFPFYFIGEFYATGETLLAVYLGQIYYWIETSFQIYNMDKLI